MYITKSARGESISRKITCYDRKAQGSNELNINYSLCYGKNIQ